MPTIWENCVLQAFCRRCKFPIVCKFPKWFHLHKGSGPCPCWLIRIHMGPRAAYLGRNKGFKRRRNLTHVGSNLEARTSAMFTFITVSQVFWYQNCVNRPEPDPVEILVHITWISLKRSNGAIPSQIKSLPSSEERHPKL